MSARTLMRMNEVATVVWCLLIPPSLLWWHNSVLWVVLMSLWANVASHFSAAIAARAELAAEDRAK